MCVLVDYDFDTRMEQLYCNKEIPMLYDYIKFLAQKFCDHVYKKNFIPLDVDTYLFKVHSNIVLPSTTRPPQRSDLKNLISAASICLLLILMNIYLNQNVVTTYVRSYNLDPVLGLVKYCVVHLHVKKEPESGKEAFSLSFPFSTNVIIETVNSKVCHYEYVRENTEAVTSASLNTITLMHVCLHKSS